MYTQYCSDKLFELIKYHNQLKELVKELKEAAKKQTKQNDYDRKNSLASVITHLNDNDVAVKCARLEFRMEQIEKSLTDIQNVLFQL